MKWRQRRSFADARFNRGGKSAGGGSYSIASELLDHFVAHTPELATHGPIKLHGLRAMAVCDRRLDGLEHQEIAAQLCMSLPMVMRYSRQIDQEALARRGNAKREHLANKIVKPGGSNL